MKRQKHVFVSIALLFVFLCCPFPELGAIVNAQTTNQNISFRWAFVASTGPVDNKKYIPITKDTVLLSGDRFKMMVELQNECYLYVVFKSSTGEILKLFPENEDIFMNNSGYLNRQFYLPGGESWFVLDNVTGTEKIYLLASHIRLSNLENVLERYAIANEEMKEKLAAEVVEIIKKTRKKQKQFTVTAERPEQIGGTVRLQVDKNSSSEVIDAFTMTISGDVFFAKTFTIEHRQ